MEEPTENETKEKWPTAKTISKIFKFISTFGVVICAIFKWAGILPGATIGEICGVWATVYGLGAGTIDTNIIIDKFRTVEQ